MKGLVLAGGTGSRLFPTTSVVSKQLLPIYDKPLIYYPIATLMHAGIREIGIITTREEQSLFVRLLGDGSQYGVSFTYLVQPRPEGIAQAFLIAEDFLKGEKVCLILGDNLFHGPDVGAALSNLTDIDGAFIFGYSVSDPERYGVVAFTESGSVLDIEEKPLKPKSNFAIPGIYFCDGNAVAYAKKAKPSARGELEITSILQEYLENEKLVAKKLSRGSVWLDTGTFKSMNDASNFVRVVEERQGLKIACLEEISFRNGFISKESFIAFGEKYKDDFYSKYFAEISEHI